MQLKSENFEDIEKKEAVLVDDESEIAALNKTNKIDSKIILGSLK